MRKEFDILGANHFALSMILETLLILHKDVKVYIYQNTSENAHKDKGIPYTPDGVLVEERTIADFKESGRPTYVAGMSPKSRKLIFEDFKNMVDVNLLEPLIFPNVIVASTAKIGYGVRIENNVSINPFASIGHMTFINRSVTVGHHTSIGNYVNINPGAHITGECNIGDGVTIGAGAILNDCVTVGAGSIIGSGSVVTKNIPAGVVAYGSPAKIIREVD